MTNCVLIKWFLRMIKNVENTGQTWKNTNQVTSVFIMFFYLSQQEEPVIRFAKECRTALKKVRASIENDPIDVSFQSLISFLSKECELVEKDLFLHMIETSMSTLLKEKSTDHIEFFHSVVDMSEIIFPCFENVVQYDIPTSINDDSICDVANGVYPLSETFQTLSL